jgi:hypothetical protein
MYHQLALAGTMAETKLLVERCHRADGVVEV